MKQTTNYNLKKIELTDSPPDITVHSGNFDIIDEELKRLDDDKVDKEEDKQLSDENYTKDEKDKLADIEEEANNYTHPTGAGNKHIPSGGASGQVLKYAGTSGTAKWENEAVTDVIDNLTSSDTDKALSAKQGKALSDTIGPLANLLTTIKTSIVNAINSLKEDVDGHLAEEATQAHNGITISNSNELVTVGSNGDFETINEAIKYLITKYPSYNTSNKINTTATIKLLSGFIMAEQVLVEGLNLGWVEIIGEDNETVINGSALTVEFTFDTNNYRTNPAFGVSNGTLPKISQLFNMQTSTGSDKTGISVINNGDCFIAKDCGIKNAQRYGLFVSGNSRAQAENSIFSGASEGGIFVARSSAVNAASADASNAGEHGIYANQGSSINAVNANASNAGKNGIYANQGSSINAWGADAHGADEKGIYANQSSSINIINVNARKITSQDSSTDIVVGSGSLISLTTSGNYKTIGGCSQELNKVTSSGIIFG